MTPIAAPFPWFGGKRKIAASIWQRFGNPPNYVEPFFGSGAVLLNRPQAGSVETINDLDGFVANFWRACKSDPLALAEWAESPVNENDLHARHAWLLAQRASLVARLEGDPDFCDAKIAGWWVWGVSCWIGSGWCGGRGPWVVEEGALVDGRKLPHLGDNGRGVNRQLPHLGGGQGVNRKLPHLGDNGQGRLVPWFAALADRLARVRVCSGDWSRVCGPSVTWRHGPTAVFLDPPYADTAGRADDLYAHDSLTVAHDVREWAIEEGKRPDMRIALCGYEGEHEMPSEWAVEGWSAGSGFGGQAEERTGNGRRERVWYSPACLSGRQGALFDLAGAPR